MLNGFKGISFGCFRGRYIKIIRHILIIATICLVTFLLSYRAYHSWSTLLKFDLFTPEIPGEVPVGEIISDIEVRQTFILPSEFKELNGFSLFFGTGGRKNFAEITVSFIDNNDHIVQQYNLKAEMLADNSFVDFVLSQSYNGDSFTITVKSDGVSGNAITLWSSVKDVYKGGILTINGIPTGGDICFRLYGDQKSLLLAFSYMILILTILVLSGCYLAMVVMKKMVFRYAIIIFFVGFMYAVVMTPYSFPDSTFHVENSEKLSNALLHNNKLNLIGATFVTGRVHFQTSTGYVSLIKDLFKIDHSVMREYPLTGNMNYPPAYLPQAIGISVARLLWINNIWVYYAGIITNLLFYTLVVATAIKIIPECFRNELIVLALLPMSLHQAASYSYDTFMNALSFLFVGYTLKLWADDIKIRANQIIILILIVTLLAPLKVVYGFLGLCIFIIPQNKFISKQQYYGTIISAVLFPLFVTLIFNKPQIINVTQNSHNGYETYTVGYVLQNPLKAIKIFIDTTIVLGEIWINWFVGHDLAGLSLPVPARWINAYCGVLLLSIFSNIKTKCELSVKDRLILFIVCVIIYLGILGSMLIVYTHYTNSLIEGVQGRYFIPIALPLLCVCSNRYLCYYKKDFRNILIVCAVLLNIIITNYVAWVTIVTI